MGVDARHRMGNCSTAQACVETSEPDRLISSASTSFTAELGRHSTTTSTTMPPTSTRTTEPSPPPESQCNVPNCTFCVLGEGVRCSACADGYVLTDEGQCMQNSESLEAKRFTTREAERLHTLKVLQAFAAAMPSLGWSGDDFCSWSGVRCSNDVVRLGVSWSWVTGTLPEMPDDVDYSMVRLDEVDLNEKDGIMGTLPSSWGKLRRVRTISLGYTSVSGTLPAAWASMSSLRSLTLSFTDISGTLPAQWSSMASIEQIILSNTQISGTLPEAWSGLRNLRRIYLNRCNLYGSLPQSWARMPSLERVRLESNDLCGCIPSLWLRGLTARVDVDAKQRMPVCATTEACIAMSTRDLAASSWSTSAADEPTSPPPPSDPYCNVPKCLWCLSSDPMRCGVCSDGYLLTAGWQCLERTF